jgi:hypothetical protein
VVVGAEAERFAVAWGVESAQFAEPVRSEMGVAVPEPSMMIGCVIAGAWGLSRRRRAL